MGNIVKPVGDQGIMISFGNQISDEINGNVTSFVTDFKKKEFDGIIDIIPAYSSVLISYDPFVWEYKDIKEEIEVLLTAKRAVPRKEKEFMKSPCAMERVSGRIWRR